jgi:hypothetical protein
MYFYFQNGAHIENSSSGNITFDLAPTDTAYVGYPGGISGSFTNAGTLTLSGAAGTVSFRIPFSNSGSVDIGESTLQLGLDSIYTGSFTVPSGATLQLYGGAQTFETGMVLSGAGHLQVSGATLSVADPLNFTGSVTVSSGSADFNGSTDLVTLTLSGGSLGGSGDVTVSGDFTWSGNSTLTGSGAFTTSGTSTIGGWVYLDGRTLTNSGAATWEVAGMYFYFQNGAHIENSSSGSITFDFASTSTANVGYSSGTSGSFTNAGTLTLSGAAGTVQFGIPFSNSGSVDIGGSALGLSRDGTLTGSFTVPSGARLALGGGRSQL